MQILRVEACFFLFNAQDLAKMKIEIQTESSVFESAFSYLMQQADLELLAGPYSVMEKQEIPPSGNRHDYLSLARFFWPNPSFETGVPYIYKDCEMNPEIYSSSYDYAKKNRVIRSCVILSLAYYLSSNENYALHASLILETWFLNPLTRMNPHLNFAQIRPGITYSNCFGIIEGHTFPFLFECLQFLESSPHWRGREGMRLWAKQYLEWLLTSPQGIEEQRTLNNHASWYDFQTLYFALYTDQKDLALDLFKTWTFPKLKSHFLEDGRQPYEMLRKKNFYYSLFNLQALYHCALLGDFLMQDLWEKGQKETLRKGIDFLVPYFLSEKKWIQGSFEPVDCLEFSLLLIIASAVYNRDYYLNLYEKLEREAWLYDDSQRQISYKLLKLFYPKPFFSL